MPENNVAERLALLLYQMLYKTEFDKGTTGSATFEGIHDMATHMWETAGPEERASLRQVRRDVSNPVAVNPPWLQEELLLAVGGGLIEKGLSARGISVQQIGFDGIPNPIWKAAARLVLGFPMRGDKKRLDAWLDKVSQEGGRPSNTEGDNMATNTPGCRTKYTIDIRNLPREFADDGKVDAYWDAVEQRFRDRNCDPAGSAINCAHVAYVAGALLRDSYFDPNTPGFDDAFVDIFNEGYEVAESSGDGRIRKVDVYKHVADEIEQLKGKSPATVQEIAAVSDDVFRLGPVDDNLTAKVRSAHDDYVGKTPVYDSLELPDIVVDETARAELEPANIRAVGMVYAAANIELTGLPMACDISSQDWSDGVLPVGESAGQLFDAYIWNARDRLDPAARQIQFDRIAELDSYLLRFCSAASEFDRRRYLSEYLLPGPGGNGQRPSPEPRDANVRKTARDLLAYASLHGWAYTQFAARRLGNQIRECVEIAENAEVQKAYGVQGPWQFVERATVMQSGTSPNISKYRTLASTGKAILDTLALKAKDIGASLARDPLFPVTDVARSVHNSVFSTAEYNDLLNHVENWLAASGVTDEQRQSQSQIRDVSTAPSLPNFEGGFGGMGADGLTEKVNQIIATGQMPTFDQFKQMVTPGS